jgi:hypothetical protein
VLVASDLAAIIIVVASTVFVVASTVFVVEIERLR